MEKTIREIDGWEVTLRHATGGWVAEARNWCDDEAADGPDQHAALERLAGLIRVAVERLEEAFNR